MLNEGLLERGKQLFTTLITAEIDKTENSTIVDLLKFLLKQYEDQVAPMAIEDKFAAKRMALACIQAVSECGISSPGVYDSVLQESQRIYDELPIGGVITFKKEASTEETKQINKELNVTSDNLQKKIVADLIWDTPAEELNVEGARVRGLLSADFDSTEDIDDFVIEESEGVFVADVSYDEYGNMVLTCPKCSSVDLVLETVTGCCLTCDCEFNIPLNLSDSIDENATCDFTPLTIPYARTVKRTEGEKKNRGIIFDGESSE